MDVCPWCELGIRIHCAYQIGHASVFKRSPAMSPLTGTVGIPQGFRLLFFVTRKRNYLSVSGNFNCASVARIPRVRVLEDEEGSKDIELSDDPYDCIRLSVENVPCIVTLCKVWACIWWFLSFLLVSFNPNLLSYLTGWKVIVLQTVQKDVALTQI